MTHYGGLHHSLSLQKRICQWDNSAISPTIVVRAMGGKWIQLPCAAISERLSKAVQHQRVQSDRNMAPLAQRLNGIVLAKMARHHAKGEPVLRMANGTAVHSIGLVIVWKGQFRVLESRLNIAENINQGNNNQNH